MEHRLSVYISETVFIERLKIYCSVRASFKEVLSHLTLEHSGKAQIRKMATLPRDYGKTDFFRRQFRALGLGSCVELAFGEALSCLNGKLGKVSQPWLAEGTLVVSALLRVFFVPNRNVNLGTCEWSQIQCHVSVQGLPQQCCKKCDAPSEMF